MQRGVRVDLAAVAVSALGSWISSVITALLDGSCCIKLRHASTYLVKMKTATKKKRERKTNRLVTHLAQVEKWKQLWWPKGRLYEVGNCRFSGHLTVCACRGTNSMIKQVCMLDHIYTLWIYMCVCICVHVWVMIYKWAGSSTAGVSTLVLAL